MKGRGLLAALVTLLVIFGFGDRPAGAQSAQRIAAIVNDAAISTRDLRTRVQFVILTGNFPHTAAAAKQLAPRVLDALIDEQLQLQEAGRLGFTANEQELRRARSDAEQRFSLRPGEFAGHARSLGLSLASATRQLEAGILWNKLVQRRYTRENPISEEEVREALETLEANKGKRQIQLFEIVLPIPSPAQEPEVLNRVRQIAEEVRGGASFTGLARQFSSAASAASGGVIGWVLADNLAPEIAEALVGLKAGQMSAPVQTVLGYHLLLVNADRRIMEADPMLTKVDLKQLFVPIAPGTDQVTRAQQAGKALEASQAAGSCEELAAMAREAGSPVSPDLGVFTIGELAADLRRAVLPLKAGETSQPITLPGGLMVLMVCSRDEARASLPSPEQIREQLDRQRLQVVAQRYLRDLRRQAFIDKRL